MTNHILIGMDYCSDPIWVSMGTNGPESGFANDDLDNYKDRLSIGLLHALTVYQKLWEVSLWSKYTSPSDCLEGEFPMEREVFSLIRKMESELALRVKQELPEYHVYFYEHTLLGNALMEVSL